MAKTKHKITVVREHPRKTSISLKNPTGITIVDRHPRRIAGSYLDREEIEKIYNSYDKKNITYPKKTSLDFSDGNKYNEVIAVWTDYFNKKFDISPPLDVDSIKALIASESGFQTDTPKNKIAFGIMQITNETFGILQDPKGESRDFLFRNIRKKDLKNPNINIPMGIRWLAYKQKRAENKLSRTPTYEEIILEYKGLLKSKTSYKDNALKNYKGNYDKLKSKK